MSTTEKSSRQSILALVVLLAAVLVFFSRVLFTHHYLIPWDFRGFHLPIASVVFDAMKGAGSILWDTSTYCGRPFFADPQAQAFYPPTDAAIFVSTFFGISSLAYVLEWELVLHIFAAGAFTWLLLRRMGVSSAAALAGGLVFELGGFFASQTQHFDTVEGAIWMPLMWAAAWELRRTFSGKWFCVLAIAGALSILAGVPQMSATAIASTLIFSGMLLVFRETQWRAAVTVVPAFALAAGLSAIMLAPALQLTLLSVAKYRSDWFKGWGTPPQILKSLVWPPPHGQSCDLLYCGIGGLILAVIAVFRRTSRKSALPLACLTALSAVWMLGNGTVFGRVVWAIIPKLLQGSLYPYYAMAPFCLGVAALAGLGLDRIARLTTAHKYAVAVLVAADLIAVGSGRPMNAEDVRKVPGITRDRIDGSAATLARLRQLAGPQPPFRTDTYQGLTAFSTTAPLTQLPTANGYNPLVLERLIQVRLSFAQGYRWGAWYEVEDLASPVIDALNIRYLLTSKSIPPVTNGRRRYLLSAELSGFSVYENSSALPRFWLVHKVHPVRTAGEAFTEIRRPDFSPANLAVVEGLSDFGLDGSNPGRDEGVAVQRYHAREIALAVRAGAPAFLVTSEVQYPGWHAWIDDTEVPILMTNGAFRGLAVPAGDHVVRFRFTPLILIVGAAISALSLCAAGFVSHS